MTKMLQTEQRVVLASFAAITLMAILTIMAVFGIRTSKRQSEQVTHTYQVQGAIADVLSLVKDAETATRGFIITGQDQYLEPYTYAKRRIDEALARVKMMTRDNSLQQENLERAANAIHHRIELLEKAIQQRRVDPNPLRDKTVFEYGRLEMDRIRLLLGNMSDVEDDLLDRRTWDAEITSRRVELFVGLLLGGVCIIAMVLYMQVHGSTRQRQETESLRRSESRFRSIADRVPSVLWQLNPDGKPVFINRTWYEYTGCTIEEYQQDFGQRYVHPDDWESMWTTLMQAVRAGTAWQAEFRLHRHDGVYGWFIGQGIPLWGSDGKMECFVGQTVEVTALHEAKQDLEAERQRLAVTLQSIGDGVVTTDTEGKVCLLNREGELMTGWKQEDAQGKSLSEVFRIVHEHTRLPIEDPVRKVMRSGRTVELENHTILISRDGTERVIADSAAPIRDTSGAVVGTVLVFRDSTQKEKLSQEMFRSSKLESLGMLAGGIAHDFNNLLATILGHISILDKFPDDKQSVQSSLDDARKACLKARDLTQQLLTFSKGGAPVKKLANIRDVIVESCQFALHGASATVTFDVALDLYPVMVDSSQISQVLHNIVINAAQASPAGGLILVRARNLPNHPSGRMVRISVEDHGAGILPDHLLKIFDPYFTTKADGTGLGLASAYSIIKKHEGEITVDSEVGRGSIFHIDLPAQENVIPEKRTSIVDTELKTGAGRLLVLEDDRMLARMLKLMLGNLGYEATVAHTGTQAIDFFREGMVSGRAFDGCILDLTLAGSMSGAEALTHLRQLDPNVRALVCSGYSNDRILADFRTHGFQGIVVKPYSIEDISHAVGKLLEKKTSPEQAG